MPKASNSVRAAGPSRTVILFLVARYAVMIFGGVVLILAGLGRGANAARIDRGPTARATASVISREEEDGRYRVYYAFQPPGAAATYVGIEEVSSDDYVAADEGPPVEIEYLASDPNTNWVVGHSLVLDEVIACIAGLVLGVFVIGVTQWRYRLRGIREGWRKGHWP